MPAAAFRFRKAIDALPIPQMWVDGFNYRYFAGRKVDGGRETYASIIVSENNREIYTQLVVAELGAIENKMVDAAAMAKGLGEAGHIALYGIYFDTDKAVVKPESRPTLEQIAKLLAGQPQLNVFIVGHTDNQGAHDYNLDLSRRRAEAVAAELVKNFRIAQARLRTAGVGFLAPVGSNANERRPRVEPPGRTGGAVASTRGPMPALAAKDNGYDQVQWFQSRNGNCGCRAGGKPAVSRAGANAFRGPFTTAPPRHHRRAFSIVQFGNGRGHRRTVLEALQGECLSAVRSRR